MPLTPGTRIGPYEIVAPLGAGGLALTIQLVDGPTLADRLARGAIPLDEALPIARQIAEVLEAVHDQGIVHRDIDRVTLITRLSDELRALSRPRP